MSTFRCKRCGHCCIVARSIHLGDEEVNSGTYKVNKKEKTMIMKIKFIPELNRKKIVCCYYDPRSHLCLIHDKKPDACKHFRCTSKNKKGKVIGNEIQGWMDEFINRKDLLI